MDSIARGEDNNGFSISIVGEANRVTKGAVPVCIPLVRTSYRLGGVNRGLKRGVA